MATQASFEALLTSSIDNTTGTKTFTTDQTLEDYSIGDVGVFNLGSDNEEWAEVTGVTPATNTIQIGTRGLSLVITETLTEVAANRKPHGVGETFAIVTFPNKIHSQNTDTGTSSTTFDINNGGNGLILDSTGLTSDRTLTSPDASGEITVNDAAQTLSNKTLTSPVLNGSLSGTAFIDDDTLATATATNVASAESVKTYADNLAIAGSPDASESTKGIAELATQAEVDAGTDANRITTPDKLAGSYAGTKTVQCLLQAFDADTATGDGQFYFTVTSDLNGMDLVEVGATVVTAGTTGTTDVQIHNVTDAVDMLSTKITIDSAETDSSTAATPPVIDTANDDVATGDVIRIDVDAVSTTPAQGLRVRLLFRLP